MLTRIVAFAAAASAALLGLTAAAQASSGSITVQSASSPSAQAGLLSVVLEATTPVVPGSIEAQMFAPGSSTPALTVSDFTLTSGKNTGGTVTTWTVASPITQKQLALGRYSITVMAADTGGDTADAQDVGTLALVVYPTVTLSVSPVKISYGQTVTFSGTDIGLYPDGSHHPVAGQQVNGVTTDSSGDFSWTLQAGIGIGGSLLGDAPMHADALANSTTAGALSNDVTSTVIPDPMRVTGVVASPAVISFPAGVTFTGKVSYASGTTWLPYASQQISADTLGKDMCSGDTCPGHLGWGTQTGADGSFSIAVPGPQGPDTYALTPKLPAEGVVDWFTVSAPSIKVPVRHLPVSSYLTTADLAKGKVQLRGCVVPALIKDLNAAVYAPDLSTYPNARFQYAASKSGPWRTVSRAGAVRMYYGPPKHITGCYRITVLAPRRAVYYRITTPATTAYRSAVSPAFRVRK